MAVAAKPAEAPRARIALPWIVRAPASMVRGAFVLVGAVAERAIKPQRTPYRATPASIVILSSDGRDGTHR